METNPKKSIDSLKDQAVDGQNVKGGFVLTKSDNTTAYYTVSNADDKNAALSEAKLKGFKYAVLTNKSTGESKTFTF